VILHPGCDDTVEILGVRDAVTGAPLNAATATYALQELVSGVWTAVAGGTGTYTYVADSVGNYRGEVDAAVTELLSVNRPTRAKITVVEGGYKATAYVPVTVQNYTGEPAY
jgi:hypothetical protein